MIFPFPESWDAFHPIIVHFPIALLLIAPVFILLSLFFPKSGKVFTYSALILMVLGTISIYLAISAGRAAEGLVELTPEISSVLERHEDLALLTRTLFAALTCFYAVIVLVPSFLKRKLNRLFSIGLTLIFLALYMASTLALVWTAYNGGRLVHEFGVHALM